MSSKQAIYLNWGISIIFALAMIFTPLFDGLANEQTMTYLLVALWFIPFSLLSRVSAKEAGKNDSR